MANGIPLGMGCGSSAAAAWQPSPGGAFRPSLDGVPTAFSKRLAVWKATLTMLLPAGWEVLWLPHVRAGGVHVARVVPSPEWRAIVVLPAEPLATSKARAVLPSSYSSKDVVANLQSLGLLGLAFTERRGDLLRIAMRDRIHQPYRAPICTLLPRLQPLAGNHGILGVALSGAGPAVLVIVSGEEKIAEASAAIRDAVEACEMPELMLCRFESVGANYSFFH